MNEPLTGPVKPSDRLQNMREEGERLSGSDISSRSRRGSYYTQLAAINAELKAKGGFARWGSSSGTPISAVSRPAAKISAAAKPR